MDPRLEIIATLIEKDLRRTPSVGKLCQLVSMSSSRFYELFKSEMKTCPAFYVRNKRLDAAKNLLETTVLTVKEIAAQVGFKDLSHFVRDFKKRFGLTPITYRKQNFKALNFDFEKKDCFSSEYWPVERRIGQ